MKRVVLLFFAFIIFISVASISWGSFPASGPFQVQWDKEAVELTAGQSFYVNVKIGVPDGYYLYADETEIDFASLEGLIIKDIDYPMPSKRKDPYIGKVVDVYENDVTIGIAGEVPDGLDPGEHELLTKVRFRGCSDKICFRPDEKMATFLVNVIDKAAISSDDVKGSRRAERESLAPIDRKGGFAEFFRISDFGKVMNKGLGFAVLIVFLAGILTSLTPCVWPIVPAILTFVGVHPHKKFWENMLLSVLLTSGLVLVYSILGIVAVAFGKNLGFLFQYRWFLIVVIFFFISMSLSMFGVFDIRLPHKWHQKVHGLGGKGYLGAFLAGLGLGLVASPCAGPVLASLLGYVALQRSYLFGFALLIVFSIGMGLLFIILGTCYGELANKLKGGRWMIWIRRALGLLLLFPAIFYIGSVVKWQDGEALDKPRVEWLFEQGDAIQFGAKTGRPIMIEFTADWCPPCKTLDTRFFRRDDIVKLSYLLVPLRIDATVESDDVRNLMDRYQVMGMPAVIFLNPNGNLYGDLSVSAYDPKKIESSMREAIRRAAKR
ncbi:MAG: thioredoxin fold domain-containing protein [Deltaproteobacteria bacterium]|jgi:thioredoxin:protein disulfide reductase|nr:thioredoxin fold domain-containing protein [Deltaproteobacteria bacterium]